MNRYFKILEVDIHASEKEIKAAYAKKLKIVDRSDVAAFQQLQDAYRICREVAKNRKIINVEDEPLLWTETLNQNDIETIHFQEQFHTVETSKTFITFKCEVVEKLNNKDFSILDDLTLNRQTYPDNVDEIDAYCHFIQALQGGNLQNIYEACLDSLQKGNGTFLDAIICIYIANMLQNKEIDTILNFMYFNDSVIFIFEEDMFIDFDFLSKYEGFQFIDELKVIKGVYAKTRYKVNDSIQEVIKIMCNMEYNDPNAFLEMLFQVMEINSFDNLDTIISCVIDNIRFIHPTILMGLKQYMNQGRIVANTKEGSYLHYSIMRLSQIYDFSQYRHEKFYSYIIIREYLVNQIQNNERFEEIYCKAMIHYEFMRQELMDIYTFYELMNHNEVTLDYDSMVNKERIQLIQLINVLLNGKRKEYWKLDANGYNVNTEWTLRYELQSLKMFEPLYLDQCIMLRKKLARSMVDFTSFNKQQIYNMLLIDDKAITLLNKLRSKVRQNSFAVYIAFIVFLFVFLAAGFLKSDKVDTKTIDKIDIRSTWTNTADEEYDVIEVEIDKDKEARILEFANSIYTSMQVESKDEIIQKWNDKGIELQSMYNDINMDALQSEFTTCGNTRISISVCNESSRFVFFVGDKYIRLLSFDMLQK